MNTVLAFVIGLFVGAVFVVFIIGLFVVEEDENERRLSQIKAMNMAYDAIEEIQREERHKMKEEWEKLSPEDRNRKLGEAEKTIEDMFKMFYEDDMK